MTARIVFTGGGTAGHVTPNLALIDALRSDNWSMDYIGSGNSVEEGMIKATGLPFHAIRSGKLRRYFSWKNFVDPFNILWGIGQSYRLLGNIKPDIVFSKGGFVAFPVVFAAWMRRIPVIAHESDMTPGLANRLSFPFVTRICLNFEAAKKHFKHPERVEVTGTPIRPELFQGDRKRGLDLCGFNNHKPVMLVMGGSLGAANLNRVLREALPQLGTQFQVIHLCGKGKVDEHFLTQPSYVQLEYANSELADLFAAADVVVSRSGANALCEILALNKPHVLVPLSAKKSRGDQIHNARYFKQQGISRVLDDDTLNTADLLAAIEDVQQHREEIIAKMVALHTQSASARIIDLIKKTIRTPAAHCLHSKE